jgi:hypothetical protein
MFWKTQRHFKISTKAVGDLIHPKILFSSNHLLDAFFQRLLDNRECHSLPDGAIFESRIQVLTIWGSIGVHTDRLEDVVGRRVNIGRIKKLEQSLSSILWSSGLGTPTVRQSSARLPRNTFPPITHVCSWFSFRTDEVIIY